MSIQEILESAGLPAQRGVYTGRDKPDAYYTFLRLLGTPAVNADDEEKERREMYRVTLFHKGDFEAQLDKTKEVLKLLQQERKITCGKQTLWEQRKAQRLKRGLQQCRKRQQQWKVYKTGKERGVAWAAP